MAIGTRGITIRDDRILEIIDEIGGILNREIVGNRFVFIDCEKINCIDEAATEEILREFRGQGWLVRIVNQGSLDDLHRRYKFTPGR